MFVIFSILSLGILSIGTIWPKKYTSTVKIYANDENIIRPLLQGQATLSKIGNRVNIAKTIIFGTKIMDKLVHQDNWLKDNPSASEIEIEKIIKKIKAHTKVEKQGKNLLVITFTDSDRYLAARTAGRLAGYFMDESEKVKQRESKAALDFIDKQANTYKMQLSKSDEKLRKFKDIHEKDGTAIAVTARVTKLRAEISAANLAIQENIMRKTTLEQQLSTETKTTKKLQKKNISNIKLINKRAQLDKLYYKMQSQLETLRLQYHDIYPDIAILKQQIGEVEKKLAEIDKDIQAKYNEESENNEILPNLGGGTFQTPQSQNVTDNKKNEASTNNSAPNSVGGINPVYQQLRLELTKTTTEIETYKIRLTSLKKTMAEESERLKRIHESEAIFNELKRDYAVTKGIYEDLLKRREKAQVSVNLDKAGQGLKFRIEEKAKLPYIPSGMRFLHFVIIAPLVGFIVPLALVILFMQFLEPRIRAVSVIEKQIKLPVLTVIPYIKTFSDKKQRKKEIIIYGIAVCIVFAIYAGITSLKIIGFFD
jgi:uncharacterized protein involved in exopolysaccharide biosynthesis